MSDTVNPTAPPERFRPHKGREFLQQYYEDPLEEQQAREGQEVLEAQSVEYGIAEDSVYGNDAHIEAPELGLFGVFDGVGADRAAYAAAHGAATLLKSRLQHEYTERFGNRPVTAAEVSQLLLDELTSVDDILRTQSAPGTTTATLAWFVEDEVHGPQVVWASIGDSRLYVYDREASGKPGEAPKLRQVSVDEGEEHTVRNALGGEQTRIEQRGILQLHPGQELILCTDGITGDTPADVLREHEIITIMEASTDPARNAQDLLRASRKHDDKVAMVLRPPHIPDTLAA